MKRLSDEAYRMISGRPRRKDLSSIFFEMSPDDQATIGFVRDAAKRKQIERDACKECDKSIAEKQMVCEIHYHDYTDCGQDNCMSCLLWERNPYCNE